MDLLSLIPIYHIVMSVVSDVEQIIGDAKGTIKREAAVAQIQANINAQLGLTPGLVETLADDAVGLLVDGVVALFNRAGIFKKAAPAAPQGILPTNLTTPAGAPDTAANASNAASNALVTDGHQIENAPVGGAGDNPPAAGGAAPAAPIAGSAGPGAKPVEPAKG